LYDRKERCQYKCQNVLAFLEITIRGHYALSNIAKSQQKLGFRKIDLTTIFANVTSPSILSPNRFGALEWQALGGSIQLTISHLSCSGFSVSS